MVVKELIEFLKTLDQDKNIFVHNMYEFLPPSVAVLTEKDLEDFSFPNYLIKITPKNGLPKVGDYFFDAF